MEAFFKHYDADMVYHIKPEEVPKELGLLEQRKVEIYPQGREACAKFMKKCQKKGWPFMVKVKKTSPITIIYEVESEAAALSGGELASFFKHYDADNVYHIKPEEAPREISLLEERKAEIFPQGREACVRFMRKCQKKGWPFVVKGKKTSPVTIYYEVDTTACVLSDEERQSFFQVHPCDMEYHIKPEEVPKELGLLEQRKVEIYPQGREACERFMRRCQKKGWPFMVKVKKTSPITIIYELDRTQIFNAWGMSSFYENHPANDTYHIKPEEAKREIGLLKQRTGETFPQGRDECVKFMKRCRKIGQPFVVKVQKTKPVTFWYEVDK